jgi:hypothetical protein
LRASASRAHIAAGGIGLNHFDDGIANDFLFTIEHLPHDADVLSRPIPDRRSTA